ncbi:MAG: NADH-quinone oxidoreductase subunit NuoN [Propionibacteriaceae bacterium]|jgi:NADH-quinone oxidoreductase subunit N|nr:NADH-quinone oxidoreductase subunit NuoN [Propionibacteriaceae bacterium]
MLTILEFTAPTLDYARLAPFLIVIGAACLGVLAEAFVARSWRHEVQAGLAILAPLAAIVTLLAQWGAPYGLADPAGQAGSVLVDGPTQLLWLLLLGFGLAGLLLFAERAAYGGRSAFTAAAASIPGSRAEAEAVQGGMSHTEVFPLALFSLSGMMLFTAANDLLVLFVALEIMSLPLYVLAALARHRRLGSQEAALKYFLLGVAASAMLLFGVALLFAYAGSFDFGAVATAYGARTGQADSLFVAGLGLTGVGLLFKLGAAPFHMWAPDVYEGAPTPVTAFMSVGVKVAAVGALLRLFYVAFGAARWTWQPVLVGVAIATMAVGAVIGIVQSDIKRLLAYSSITHAGFVLVGVVGAVTLQTGLAYGQLGSVGAVVVYVVAYGLATMAAFGAVTLVQSQGREATSLASWSGLGRRYPWFGVVMAVALLSLAGIPPLAGFIGKLAVFQAAWQGGYWWLALVAVLIALAAAYVYIRVLVVLFSRDWDPAVEVKAPGPATVAVLTGGTVGSVLVGVWPGPLTDLIAQAADFIITAGG